MFQDFGDSEKKVNIYVVFAEDFVGVNTAAVDLIGKPYNRVVTILEPLLNHFADMQAFFHKK